MKIQVLKNTDFTESQWSGGSTKQLFIYPKDSSYIDRNFQLRISTARVEVVESTFTSLSGYRRKLMILEGGITIAHQNHHSKELKPFDVDSFSGDWSTSAIGTCVDFNVMIAGELDCELGSLELKENVTQLISIDLTMTMLFIYSVEGGVEIRIAEESILLNVGQLFVASELAAEKIHLCASKLAQLVVVKIAHF